MQVFSSAPRVQLLLNGESAGVLPSEPLNYTNFGKVRYAPGNLTAVALGSDGEALAVHSVLTPGPAAAVVLSLDAPDPRTGTGTALLADGHDAALVRATVVDAGGVTAVGAEHRITFAVTDGPGRVAGVHNGDAKSHEPQAAASRRAYHGLARAVVRVTVDSSAGARRLLSGAGGIDVDAGDGVSTVAVRALAAGGEIVVTATAPGLSGGTVRIPVSADAALHSPLAAAASSVRLPLSFD